MPNRELACSVCRRYLSLLLIPLLLALISFQKAHAQGLEFNGGWAHLTQNNGTDGYAAGLAWWFTPRVTLAANYDSTWDTSSLTNFGVTSLGLVSTHSHIQNALVGPRIFFSTDWTSKHKLIPFGEVQFGESWLRQEVNAPSIPTASVSEHAFSWMLGGGVEYLLNPHWSGRMNLDLLRNHFAEQGQTNFRFVLGITYTLGKRGG